MLEQLEEVFYSLPGIEESGWEMVDEGLLGTPNGWLIEWDGVSPDGEVSPFRAMGMI
jgi:hypothetical protein